MNIRYIFIGSLYCIFIMQSSIFCANSKAPKYYPGNTQKTKKTSTIDQGGMLRVFISCCCSAEITDNCAEKATALRIILDDLVLNYSPHVISELYLLTQNALFCTSEASACVLKGCGLLDKKGNIKGEWHKLIVQMLRRPYNRSILTDADYYNQLAVIDLNRRFPEIIAKLQQAEPITMLSLTEEEFELLCSSYKLISRNDDITSDEIDQILTIIDNKHVMESDSIIPVITPLNDGA